MKNHINTIFLKLSFGLLLSIAFSSFTYAQNLTGPSPVEVGSTHTYTFNNNSTHSSHSWYINTGGTVVSSSSSGTSYTAVINWTSIGYRSVSFLGKRETLLASLSVQVEEAAPPPPIATELNYIHNITPRTPTTNINSLSNSQKVEAISYFDGLGRPAQQIGIRAGGNNEDIITHVGYDDFGRRTKNYLPYSSSVNISDYRTNALPATLNYYDASTYNEDFSGMTVADINPYSEKELDNSPLNRVEKQAAPGKDWKLGNGHEIEMDYLTNSSTEVRYYRVSLSFANNIYTPSLVLDGYYDANELSKSIVRDENHDGSSTKNHTIEEFINKEGQVVLKRNYNDNAAHDTFYIYDDFGNLTYVLPPKAEAQSNTPNASELNELCYQYRYDKLNRLIEKKVPGKGWEYIVYNKLDQPVLTQDQNLKEENKWLFTKYDVFGRVAYTGVMSSNDDRNKLQDIADMTKLLWVTKTTKPYTIAGTLIYYRDDTNVFPHFGIEQLYTINYYDNYTFDKVEGNPESAYGVTPIPFAKGLLTGSKVRVLGTDDWITSVSYYDEKSNPIYIYSHNAYLKTTDQIKSKMLFDGRVDETTTTHKRDEYDEIGTVDRFKYDHLNRLESHTQNINNAPKDEVIVQNTYDDLGQLIRKGVGGKTSASSRLQDVDYDYTIRGWLKTINNPDNLGNDLFAFGINYNALDHHTNTDNKLYNGNISETQWKTANDHVLRAYIYEYDALNRIINGKSINSSNASQNNKHNLKLVEYDKNGNIMRLRRSGYDNNNNYIEYMDHLTYSYDLGNKLVDVLEEGHHHIGFADNISQQNSDYQYDANGNMKVDKNKGIERIDYNHLDLPIRVYLTNGDIKYIYDATGIKLKKIIKESENTEYAGNYIYENGKLKFFSQPEGYVEPDKDVFRYVYQYKDHLSNIRLAYSDFNFNNVIDGKDEITEENNYYPFGLKHKGYNNNINGIDHKFGFGAKEEQSELGLGWIDITARNYDPALGRWMNLDPLAEKMRRHSPYNFGFNNPIYFQDYDGMAPSGTEDNCETGDCDQALPSDAKVTVSKGISSKDLKEAVDETLKSDSKVHPDKSHQDVTGTASNMENIVASALSNGGNASANGKVKDGNGTDDDISISINSVVNTESMELVEDISTDNTSSSSMDSSGSETTNKKLTVSGGKNGAKVEGSVSNETTSSSSLSNSSSQTSNDTKTYVYNAVMTTTITVQFKRRGLIDGNSIFNDGPTTTTRTITSRVTFRTKTKLDLNP